MINARRSCRSGMINVEINSMSRLLKWMINVEINSMPTLKISAALFDQT
jgi:hypothetical protein